MQSRRHDLQGLVYGLLGVIGFSITLPATRAAVASLDPVILGLGRALIAAALAAPLLYFTKQQAPTPKQWRGLGLVVIGNIIGFPLLVTWAMRLVPASHGAVVLGLLPLATAVASYFRAHEKPSVTFWIASGIGSLAVTIFSLRKGSTNFHVADLALVGAVAFTALGYAEGGRLARDMGGWQVICWALVLSVPFLLISVSVAVWTHGIQATPTSWMGFAYVSLVSMFLAFFAWYRGLAMGGVAKISQLQLLQPFMTLGFSSLLLHEQFGWDALLTATIVAGSIFICRRTQVVTATR